MHNGFAIALAWPETLCKRAGAWYDAPLAKMKISVDGYYKVGHSAIVLIDDKSGVCNYYDFGRYHSPHGYGRVRSVFTDHDLTIKTIAQPEEDGQSLSNIEDILSELLSNPSTHGSGAIYGAVIRLDVEEAKRHAQKLQDQTFLPYGPFINSGTNCSRFVSGVLKAGRPLRVHRNLLRYPPMLTPSPMWVIRAVGRPVVRLGLEHSENFEVYSTQHIAS